MAKYRITMRYRGKFRKGRFSFRRVLQRIILCDRLGDRGIGHTASEMRNIYQTSPPPPFKEGGAVGGE
jgi:hypothetical protein